MHSHFPIILKSLSMIIPLTSSGFMFPGAAENSVPELGFQEKPGIFRARGGFLLSLANKERAFFPEALINV